MLVGIKDNLIICNKNDKPNFERLLGNGEKLGINIKFAIQKSPEGIPQAFIIGESFIKNSPVTLILGDNLFHGLDLISKLQKCNSSNKGASLFAYPVRDSFNND